MKRSQVPNGLRTFYAAAMCHVFIAATEGTSPSRHLDLLARYRSAACKRIARLIESEHRGTARVANRINRILSYPNLTEVELSGAVELAKLTWRSAHTMEQLIETARGLANRASEMQEAA